MDLFRPLVLCMKFQSVFGVSGWWMDCQPTTNTPVSCANKASQKIILYYIYLPYFPLACLQHQELQTDKKDEDNFRVEPAATSYEITQEYEEVPAQKEMPPCVLTAFSSWNTVCFIGWLHKIT